MIVTTSTKMPVKRPVFALVQSTLKCMMKKMSFCPKWIHICLVWQKYASEQEKIWMKIPVVVGCFQVDLIRRES